MIVMKFGGTSLGDAERIRNACALVAAEREREPLVVVSALGGVTDLIIAAAREAAAACPRAERRDGGRPGAAQAEGLGAVASAKEVNRRHEVAFEAFGIDAGTPSRRLLAELERALAGIREPAELTAEALDLVMSFGERISARVFAAALEKEEGMPAVAVDSFDLGLRSDSRFGSARVDLSRDAEVARLCRERSAGKTLVTTGFIAHDPQGRITTFGRGGSDLTASLFGAISSAEEVQIWTDVNGVMTADPRIVPAARSIPRLSFAEASEIAYYGGKVLHPATMRPAIEKRIPVCVRNTLNPSHPGTVIASEVLPRAEPVKAVSSWQNIAVVGITDESMFMESGFLGKLFGTLGRHGVVVNMVSTSEVTVSFTVDGSIRLDEAAAELRARGMELEVRTERAIVCVVGERMRTCVGLAARACGALASAGVNIEMISQGASEINMAFVVGEEAREKAVRALHGECMEQD